VAEAFGEVDLTPVSQQQQYQQQQYQQQQYQQQQYQPQQQYEPQQPSPLQHYEQYEQSEYKSQQYPSEIQSRDTQRQTVTKREIPKPTFSLPTFSLPHQSHSVSYTPSIPQSTAITESTVDVPTYSKSSAYTNAPAVTFQTPPPQPPPAFAGTQQSALVPPYRTPESTTIQFAQQTTPFDTAAYHNTAKQEDIDVFEKGFDTYETVAQSIPPTVPPASASVTSVAPIAVAHVQQTQSVFHGNDRTESLFGEVDAFSGFSEVGADAEMMASFQQPVQGSRIQHGRPAIALSSFGIAGRFITVFPRVDGSCEVKMQQMKDLMEHTDQFAAMQAFPGPLTHNTSLVGGVMLSFTHMLGKCEYIHWSSL